MRWLRSAHATRAAQRYFPSRNVIFDVMPYAEAAGEYLMQFIKAVKFPRKLKVSFSSNPANEPHSTFRDMGFCANANGTFDVYICGGLGNNPSLGVKVATNIDGSKILLLYQGNGGYFCCLWKL